MEGFGSRKARPNSIPFRSRSLCSLWCKSRFVSFVVRSVRYVFCANALFVCCAVATLRGRGEPVARWTFDQAENGVIPDATGRFPARVRNESGKAGIRQVGTRTCFSVPGTHKGDCVTLGQGSAFDLPRRFTLEAWFRPHQAAPSSYTMILGKRYNRQYQLTWTNASGGTIEFYVGGGDLKLHRNWKSGLGDGRWLHIVAVYDATTAVGPNQRLYVNGRPVHAVRNPVRLASDNGALRIAQNSEMNLASRVPADWDEVAVYDHALSPEEVTVAYDKKAVRVVTVTERAWPLPLEAGAWETRAAVGAGAQAARDAMSGIVQMNATTRPGRQALRALRRGLCFHVAGKPPEEVKSIWRQKLTQPVRLDAFGYCLVRYRALGLQRATSPLPVLSLVGAAGSSTVLTSSHLVLDGRPHTCLVRLQLESPVDSATVSVRTRGTAALLELHEVRLLREPVLPVPPEQPADWGATGLEPVALPHGPTRALSEVLKKALSGEGHAIHAPLALSGETTTVAGIPFQLLSDAVVLWPSETDANVEQVMGLGGKITRRSFFPAARDAVLEVPVHQAVTEVFLLLASDLPALRKRYSRPPVPWGLTEVEAVDVELIYEDGAAESAMPYSIRDNGYRVFGLIGAYTVAVDPARKLGKIVLHNRVHGHSLGVAAVTLNTGPRRFPELAEDPKPLRVPPSATPRNAKPSATYTDGLLTLRNECCELVADCRNGFAIRELRNPCAPRASYGLAAESGVEVRVDGDVLTGLDFRTTDVQVTGAQAGVKLTCRRTDLPLTLSLTLDAGTGAGLVVSIAARNTGTTELRPDIRFPLLKSLVLDSVDNTWIFFPQYRNVITRESRFCKQPNHRGFLMQFMDVFNPVTGGGLCLMTRNLGQEPVQYALAKTDGGVTAYIENEGEDFPLAPGAEVRLCERVLAGHGGDWHGAARLYADWVKTWYTPVESQDKAWFRRAAWLRSHITSPANAKSIAHAPPVYDRESKTWRLDEFLAADTRLLGTEPDICHFYVWAFDESAGGDVSRDGEYGPKDYANLGGIASFRNAIDHLRNGRKMPVSLYTIWDRCNRDTPFFQAHGERLAKIRFTGQRLVNSRKIFISQGVPEWREHAAATLKRLQAETGADILYLDVFGTDDRSRCFNPDAEHAHVPTWVARDDAEFLKALRNALPDSVALWGEFPVPDVASQYWDGFLSYDCIPLHEYMAEAQDQVEAAPSWSESTLPPNLFRFLFPHLRQVVFPVGTEGAIDNWRFLKFLLFNGQALFDTTWRLYDSRCRNRLGRVLRLQKTYADCFDSAEPEMFVNTERGLVFANRFPGTRRTVWALFNGRCRTVSGPVLRIRHHQGAVYRDLWNDRDLTPVIEHGEALLELTLPPQGVGCVVQE